MVPSAFKALFWLSAGIQCTIIFVFLASCVFSSNISSVFCLSLHTVTVLSVFFDQLVILTNELVILELFSTTP